MFPAFLSCIVLFQSTLPRRERRMGTSTNIAMLGNFNPRSREGSDSFRWQRRSSLHNFNPRSREGSDGCGTRKSIIELISIHAPAKGATICSAVLRGSARISIHAPAKGATAVRRPLLPLLLISIHAPAKGATRFCVAT